MCFAFAWTVTQVPWHLCLSDRVEKGMTRYLVTKIMKTPEALKKLLSYIAIPSIYEVLARQSGYFLLLICLTLVGRVKGKLWDV